MIWRSELSRPGLMRDLEAMTLCGFDSVPVLGRLLGEMVADGGQSWVACMGQRITWEEQKGKKKPRMNDPRCEGVG